MTRITVPFIDANIVDVTVTGWRKAPGDCVAPGEIVAEVTTDKAAFEIESPAAGTLLAIYADVKSVVPVHYVLGLIGSPGEQDPGAETENAERLRAYRAQVATAPALAPAAGTVPTAAPTPAAASSAASAVRATPKARRLAQAHGLDLAAIQRQAGVELVTESVLEPFLPSKQS